MLEQNVTFCLTLDRIFPCILCSFHSIVNIVVSLQITRFHLHDWSIYSTIDVLFSSFSSKFHQNTKNIIFALFIDCSAEKSSTSFKCSIATDEKWKHSNRFPGWIFPMYLLRELARASVCERENFQRCSLCTCCDYICISRICINVDRLLEKTTPRPIKWYATYNKRYICTHLSAVYFYSFV
jgi:hypothetical protein